MEVFEVVSMWIVMGGVVCRCGFGFGKFVFGIVFWLCICSCGRGIY